MSKIGGLGKGLGSLIPNKKLAKNVIADQNKNFLVNDSTNRINEIEVEQVEANPMQPRQVFEHEGLEELIESIKVHGIIQPIIVTKTSTGYELIAGERRLRAAKVIGLNTVPAIVREAGEQEKLELALIENIQRKNLNPIEKGVAYQKLIDEFNLTQEEVAEKMGVSRSGIANTIRFLDLPGEVQRALADRRITEGHAKVIAGLDTEKEQLAFLKKILAHDYTVRDAEQERKKALRLRSGQARKQESKNAEVEEREDELRAALGTKVSIKESGGSGQIVIDFYSAEELDSIIDKIL